MVDEQEELGGHSGGQHSQPRVIEDASASLSMNLMKDVKDY